MDYPGIEFLFLNEQDMIKAGVKDMAACIDTMEEVIRCLNVGDYVMGGENHNSHGSQVSFPARSPFPNMPLDEGDDRRFMAMPAYIGGSIDLVGMKWYGSNSANRQKGLPLLYSIYSPYHLNARIFLLRIFNKLINLKLMISLKKIQI